MLLEYEIKNKLNLQRISSLQQKMEQRKANICFERALLYTKSFQETENDEYIIRKAKAFSKTLEEMTIYIEEDSLIVGNMACRNFAAPIFPEYSIKWVINELDWFSKREGDVFFIDEECKKVLKEIAPYWINHTHEDEVLRNIPEINILAEKQGVLHRGGISMSGDGHIVPDHEMLLRRGFRSIIEECELKLNNPNLSKENIVFYTSVKISLEGALKYIKRYGKLAKELSLHANEDRKKELINISNMCSTLMEKPAQSFYEAVQTCYFVHILQMIESNGHSFCYGRFDQYIYPYYKKDKQLGILDDDQALELITHMFIMNSSCNKVRPYSHTKFSQGYPLYSNLVVSGLLDEEHDGTNELSYLCIEAMHLTSLSEPNFSMRYHKKTPDDILRLATKLIASGCGMPSMFNDEVVVESMKYIGISNKDAYDYVPIGCVETGIPGKYGHRATGMTYVNWGKLIELLLNNGKDPKSNICLVELSDNNDYETLWSNWKILLKFYTDLAVHCDYVCDSSLSKYDADPFASCFIDNSLKLGKTLKNGGAKYDVVSQSNIGPSIVANSFMAIKELVYDKKIISMEQLKDAMENNWGNDYLKIQKLCENVAKFGNDIDEVDHICAEVFESYLNLLPAYKTRCSNMGCELSCYTMSTSNITSYVPNGLDVGATPDGRYATTPLNEGCSPTQGTDKNGPTAVIASVSKLPNHKIAAGQLLNMRFSPSTFEGDGIQRFMAFLRASCEMNIFHNQFNVIDVETLIKAKQQPQDYQNLIVRVAGYCAQFVSLMPQAQDAIIERTQNKL